MNVKQRYIHRTCSQARVGITAVTVRDISLAGHTFLVAQEVLDTGEAVQRSRMYHFTLHWQTASGMLRFVQGGRRKGPFANAPHSSSRRGKLQQGADVTRQRARWRQFAL
ncbi:hypothetical protein TRVL_06270 [Trypanosoma vivax]|nr:hypothetical protein TRVL_06270 [Trypanosoma vivax]